MRYLDVLKFQWTLIDESIIECTHTKLKFVQIYCARINATCVTSNLQKRIFDEFVRQTTYSNSVVLHANRKWKGPCRQKDYDLMNELADNKNKERLKFYFNQLEIISKQNQVELLFHKFDNFVSAENVQQVIGAASPTLPKQVVRLLIS